MQAAFDLAARQLGMNERDQQAALQEYMANGGARLDPAVTAWCAAYVNASLEQAGMQGTGSNMARSFLDWGQETQTPQKGDLAVFSRGDPNGPYGHVGFFDSINPDGTIRVLGGNQGDAVSYANYSADQLLGYRTAGQGMASQAPMQGGPMAGGNAISPASGNALASQGNALDQWQPWRSTRRAIDPNMFRMRRT